MCWVTFDCLQHNSSTWSCTWKDKYEAGGQAPDDRDDLANVRDEQGQEESQEKPADCLEHTPAPLKHYIFLHCFPLVA